MFQISMHCFPQKCGQRLELDASVCFFDNAIWPFQAGLLQFGAPARVVVGLAGNTKGLLELLPDIVRFEDLQMGHSVRQGPGEGRAFHDKGRRSTE